MCCKKEAGLRQPCISAQPSAQSRHGPCLQRRILMMGVLVTCGNGATPQEPGEDRDTPINMLREGDVHRHPPMALEDSPFAGERKWFIPLGFFGSPSPGLEGAGKTSLLYQLKLDENVRAIPVLGFNVEAVEYKNLSLSVSWCGISIRTSALGGGSQIGKHLFC